MPYQETNVDKRWLLTDEERLKQREDFFNQLKAEGLMTHDNKIVVQLNPKKLEKDDVVIDADIGVVLRPFKSAYSNRVDKSAFEIISMTPPCVIAHEHYGHKKGKYTACGHAGIKNIGVGQFRIAKLVKVNDVRR